VTTLGCQATSSARPRRCCTPVCNSNLSMDRDSPTHCRSTLVPGVGRASPRGMRVGTRREDAAPLSSAAAHGITMERTRRAGQCRRGAAVAVPHRRTSPGRRVLLSPCRNGGPRAGVLAFDGSASRTCHCRYRANDGRDRIWIRVGHGLGVSGVPGEHERAIGHRGVSSPSTVLEVAR
jgi:hypothetical protein